MAAPVAVTVTPWASAIAPENVPIAPATAPIPVTIWPNISNMGPKIATTAALLIIMSCCAGDISENFCARFCTAVAPRVTAGASFS